MRRRTAHTLTQSARGDSLLVRRAAVTIAALTAGAVTVVVAAVVLLSVALTIREQRVDAERVVREAATSAEDVSDPPPNVVLLIQRPGQAGNDVSPGAPAPLATLDLKRLPVGPSQITLGHDYRIFVSDRDGIRVVAALDRRYRAEETERLLRSLLPAGLVGIVAATIIGWLVARRAVRPLGEALALQRRFVADASHELRTPLTILHTRAQLLQRRASGDAELRENLERLTADTRALTEIVSDLLVSAEMQHRPADREPVNLGRLAGDVTASFGVLAEQHDVRLMAVVEGPGDGEEGDDMTVPGIPIALRRALSALVDNALGHVRPGGTVTVTVARRGNNVDVAVVDNGEGIDPTRVDELTQRFARGTDAPGAGRRFGLGLALVRDVVDAHDGTLTLTGTPGQGTTATISIPAAPAHS